ncbi:MAG: alpha-amylase family glycosyl hydrolase, partial [Blastomonas fulva]
DKPRTRPFDFQLKLYNQLHPDIPGFVERMRALIDSHGDKFTVAEVGGDDAEREMKLFTAGGTRFDSAYGFDFLYAEKLTPQMVADALLSWPDTPGTGWPSWAFENHDAPRALSRWVDAEHRDAFAGMKMLLLVALRGNIFLYQGEELGLPQVDIPFERLQDPEAITNWPLTLSRDGARTPMPWRHSANDLGFGSGDPWLPFGEDHAALSVDVQARDPHSLLNLVRAALQLRKTHRALATGSVAILHCDAQLLAFERVGQGQRIVAIFNMQAGDARWPEDVPTTGEVLIAVNDAAPGALPGHGALLFVPD